MKKDNVDLVCDIAELIAVFDARDNQDILQSVVSTVAWHMRAAVCSIYFYDEARQELTLRATQGLNPDAVGRVKLALGEGITGRAVEELHPVCVGRASHCSWYHHIPGIHEEHYEAFLAVPIVQRLRRVGALVVQDGVPDYFNDNDAKALRAIAAQLAPIIDNIRVLGDVHTENHTPPPLKRTFPREQLLRGQSASGGIARGRATWLGPTLHTSCHLPDPDAPPHSLEDFQRAVKHSIQQINQLQRQTGEALADVALLIFNAHLLILEDDQFTGRIADKIRGGTPAVQAIAEVVNDLVETFSTSKMPTIREKVLDVQDLGNRLMRNLLNEGGETCDYRDQIVIAHELLPSDILKLSAENVEGFIITSGITSHNAIICRSLNIPMLAVDHHTAERIDEEANLLVDASQGIIYLDPDAAIVAKYQELEAAWCTLRDTDEMAENTKTSCGERIRLHANINLLSDLEPARRFKAEGVGLYRSEFPFIVRNDFPSEEEQYGIYRKLVEQMDGLPVTFRTLDIGGDKMLSYYSNISESNPFLGMRAIRFSLQNKEIFSQQLRAFLRAGAAGNARIMFPLIASVDDFTAAREIVHECMDQLESEGISFRRDTKLGVMMELPSAVELAEELAKEADFLSIGSNDLIQYMLAVDRTNEQVSKLYQGHHPAILRAIHRIVRAARRHGKDVSICGDLAADPRMLRFLLGIGLRSLSIDMIHAPVVQRTIQQIPLAEARQVADRMLAFGRIDDVGAYLETLPE